MLKSGKADPGYKATHGVAPPIPPSMHSRSNTSFYNKSPVGSVLNTPTASKSPPISRQATPKSSNKSGSDEAHNSKLNLKADDKFPKLNEVGSPASKSMSLLISPPSSPFSLLSPDRASLLPSSSANKTQLEPKPLTSSPYHEFAAVVDPLRSPTTDELQEQIQGLKLVVDGLQMPETLSAVSRKVVTLERRLIRDEARLDKDEADIAARGSTDEMFIGFSKLIAERYEQKFAPTVNQLLQRVGSLEQSLSDAQIELSEQAALRVATLENYQSQLSEKLIDMEKRLMDSLRKIQALEMGLAGSSEKTKQLEIQLLKEQETNKADRANWAKAIEYMQRETDKKIAEYEKDLGITVGQGDDLLVSHAGLTTDTYDG